MLLVTIYRRIEQQYPGCAEVPVIHVEGGDIDGGRLRREVIHRQAGSAAQRDSKCAFAEISGNSRDWPAGLKAAIARCEECISASVESIGRGPLAGHPDTASVPAPIGRHGRRRIGGVAGRRVAVIRGSCVRVRKGELLLQRASVISQNPSMVLRILFANRSAERQIDGVGGLRLEMQKRRPLQVFRGIKCKRAGARVTRDARRDIHGRHIIGSIGKPERVQVPVPRGLAVETGVHDIH